MNSGVSAALIGGIAGLATASATSLFTRRKTAAETEKAIAEAGKIRAETEEIRQRVATETAATREEAEHLSDRVANAEASIAYDRAQQRSHTLYQSAEDGFSLFDFDLVPFNDAAAELSSRTARATDDVLVILRGNIDNKINL